MASTGSDAYTSQENVIFSQNIGPQTKQALLPLRIIYSINTSSQSLLARHKKKVGVTVVDDESTMVGGSYGFAKVSLKTCLGIVCGSSPELLADDTRDYSIYYADPLETVDILNHADTPGNHSSTIPHKGISVGVGLLSWWLSDSAEERLLESRTGDDDENLVVGRITNDRGTKSLEIIMSFKETPYKTQHEYAESMTSLGVPTASVLSLTRAPSTRPSTRPSSPSTNLSLARSNSLGSRTDGMPIPRTGRPPGASTHPEKRARRMAITSHKESLEKMKNIAMMQRGEPYDQALVGPADLNLPPITDHDIARQSKILEDLEARPLIIDRSPTLLTSKPLQRRKSTTSSTITARDVRKQRSASPTNAIASGSSKCDNPPKVADVPTTLTEESMKENQAVLSMLATILSKVDGASLAGPNIEEAGKGKVKEHPKIDNALVNTLGQLLPLLSTLQSAKPQPIEVGAQSSSLFPTPPLLSMGQWDPQRIAISEQHSRPPIRLFPTTEETFYNQERGSYFPYDRHWVQPQRKGTVSQDPPKVSPETHPVPGGGWARGKNLVPRSALPDPTSSTTSQRDQTGAKCIIDLTQPDKKNMPPSKVSRGLKRSSSLLGGDDKENRNDKPREKNHGKRRKQGSSLGSAGDSNKALTSKRTLLTGGNHGPGSQNCTTLATSPIRPNMTGIASDTMPVMAMSEPDFARSGPIVANSSFPDIIMGPPRTPPRRKEKDSAGSVEDSWVAPDPRTTPQAEEKNTTFSSSLFTPSPVRGKIRFGHVASDMLKTASSPPPGQGSDTQSIKTGWDLPPSSPPAPTSPVSPLADVGSADDDAVPDESIDQVVNEPDGVADKNGKNISSGNDGIGIETNAMAQEATTILLGSSAPSSDFDALLDADFRLGFLDGEHGETAVQNELDFDELWKTLGPVLMQAQNDSTNNNVESTNASAEEEQTGLHFFEMSDNNDGGQTGDMQNDALRTAAEELKALFGGCVV